MGKYIPGNPTIVVLNQPGAGGLLAVNYAAKRAAGRHVGTLVSNGLLLFQALGQPGLEVSLGDFKWLGNFSAANGITVAMDTSGVKIEEAKAAPRHYRLDRRRIDLRPSAGGLQRAGRGPSSRSSMAMRARRRWCSPCGAADSGPLGSALAPLSVEFPDEVKAGKLVALSQIGTARDPRLPDAPL